MEIICDIINVNYNNTINPFDQKPLFSSYFHCFSSGFPRIEKNKKNLNNFPSVYFQIFQVNLLNLCLICVMYVTCMYSKVSSLA